jgi:alpha-N-arabinofuranosidase
VQRCGSPLAWNVLLAAHMTARALYPSVVLLVGSLGSLGSVGCAVDATDDLEASAIAGQRIVVDVAAVRHDVGPTLLGANINDWAGHANGLWDAALDAPDADAVAKAAKAHLGLLRFPGGTSANLYHWKRSVGPRAGRRCQVAATNMQPHLERDYGPAAFGTFIDAVGAAGEVMVPFAVTSPEAAADLVEYMNAPVGTNPNGGVAWADVRAADGHPDPIGVRRWEIGNEPDRADQGYWLGDQTDPQAERSRMTKYIDGAHLAIVDQPLGRDCDFDVQTSSGAAAQEFSLRWGLVKRGTVPVVKVGGTAWTAVADLASAGANARVYVFDRETDLVRFGDGVHGAIPAAGARVTVTYTLVYDGFVALSQAMHDTAAAIGTPIDVCSAWAPVEARGSEQTVRGTPSFARAMANRGQAGAYDCVVIHPYTSFARDFDSAWQDPRDAHQQMMIGDGWAKDMVGALVDDVTANGTPGADGRVPYVAISELGALWFGDSAAAATSHTNVPAATYMMSHGLYMASQWLHFARLRVRWVEGNTLVADPGSLRGTLGGKNSGFVYGAEAMVREALGPAFSQGSQWLGNDVENAVIVDKPDGSYRALLTGATRDAAGDLWIIVVNRRLGEEQANIVVKGMAVAGQVAIKTVHGKTFASANDGDDGPGDDGVRIDTSTRGASTTFSYTFPPASVTVFHAHGA